jgi:hypothetical protein
MLYTKKLLGIGALTALPIMAFVACGEDDPKGPAPMGTTGGNVNAMGGAPSAGGTGGAAPAAGGTGGAAPAAGGTGGVVNAAGSGGEVNAAGSGGDVNAAGSGGGVSEVPCVPGKDALGDDLPTQVIPKPLREPEDADQTFTLTKDKTWVLEDVTVVNDGQVLTIEPCTKIVGSPAPKGSLVVARGGKLMAKGTANAPIVFTSALPVGARGSGQWGGVIILGRATNNKGTNVQVEGLPANPTYQHGAGAGAPMPEESSGELQYVRIEFGGIELSMDNEINGLTMGSIGSGTLISHIMVKSNLDDCFEWFGGTANASYLVADNCGDDMFDADQGFSGIIDTHFGRQRIKDSANPNGYELDSDNTLNNLQPTMTATFKNGTVCGLNEAGGATAFGAVIRTSASPTLDEIVMLGFDEGIDLRNNVGTLEAPRVTWTNSILRNRLNNVRDPAEADNDGGFDENAWFLTPAYNNSVTADPGFTTADCLAAGGPTDAVKNSGRGAFKNGAAWMEGSWINWERN